MYNVSKGPSKLVTQTRRGISQHLERLENRKDSSRKSSDNGQVHNQQQQESVPKPVFHSNGYMKRSVSNGNRRKEQPITPQHAEIIQFIHDSWSSIHSQYEQYSPASSPGGGSNYSTSNSTTQPVIYYQDDVGHNILLDNFKPFDLETWWSKQLYNKLTTSL